MDSGNGHTSLIVRIDLPSDKVDDLLILFENGFDRGTLDGYYFLTRNKTPVVHKEPHLQYESRLGAAIAAIQRDEILFASLADTDPETGIEYGELT